jgi:transposase
MLEYTAEDLVFLDETIVNELTGFRYNAYGPIGSPVRYVTDISRGLTWSIIAAIDVDDWLDCSRIKLGYYNTEAFITWLKDNLFPCLRAKYGPQTKVIVMDNVNTHCSEDVERAIYEEGHLVEYLPPYSPDFNPIELSFSVLKAWIRRYFWHRRCEVPSFGAFLRMAISEGRPGRFARKQFRHAASGLYLERAQIEEVRWQLDEFVAGRAELGEGGEEAGFNIEVVA